MEGPSRGHKQHLVEDQDRGALAGPTLSLRSVADVLRPLRSLETRWYLGSAAGLRTDEVRRSERGGVGSERGQHDLPGTPARGGSPATSEPGGRKKGVEHPKDEALGRSRGGLSTKLHLACDGKGRPLSVVVSPGQRHESTQLGAVLDAIRVERLGVGRPRKRPERVIADRGYSFPSCRLLLRRRGIPHVIPQRRDQRERRTGHPGRRPSFDAALYAQRNIVERCVGRLKQWRGVATRYEKRAVNYRAVVTIVALVMWLTTREAKRAPNSVSPLT